MKQEIINTITPERQMYVPASVKVIEVSARRVLCQSGLTGSQNEEYEIGDTSGWFNN